MIYFLFLLNAVWAQDICTDLHYFSCQPGYHDDGTGKVIGGDQERTKAFRATAKQESKKVAIKFLETKASLRFKELALEAFGLDTLPACKVLEVLSSACAEHLATGLVTYLSQDASSAGDSVFGGSRDKPFSIESLRNLKVLPQFEIFEEEIFNAHLQALENQQPVVKIKDVMIPKLKKLLIEKIESFEINDKIKNKMKAKISTMSYDPNICSEAASTTFSKQGIVDAIENLYMPNAYYDDLGNRICVTAAAFMSGSSDFNIGGTVLHEMAHAIGPCAMYEPYGGETDGILKAKSDLILDTFKEFPLFDVLECLTSKKSANIQTAATFLRNAIDTRKKSLKEHPSEARGIKKEIANLESMRASDLSILPQTVNVCEGMEHLNEAFADWLMADTLPEYIAGNDKLSEEQRRIGYANVYRDICSFSDSSGEGSSLDKHPTSFIRINAIILANPKIRKQMGCEGKPSPYDYCKGNLKRGDNKTFEKSMEGVK